MHFQKVLMFNDILKSSHTEKFLSSYFYFKFLEMALLEDESLS